MEFASHADNASVTWPASDQQFLFRDLAAHTIAPGQTWNDQENGLSVLELCAGAGGQAIGFEKAGFSHAALVEIDRHACATLRLNRPQWNVIEADVRRLDGVQFRGVDLIAGGLPCPPFSVAGKQLGCKDERNLFPELIRLVAEAMPRAIMVENVRGLLEVRFEEYRRAICSQLANLGYHANWKLLNATDFGVSQLRQRAVLVALRREYADGFDWPAASPEIARTVGDLLLDLMGENGWKKAQEWSVRAQVPAPTIVGGSHKHGGPDLGPTRARKAWAQLGVDGLGIANHAPPVGFSGPPRLTLRMVARIQGFPDSWHFAGGKTAAYRQIGNAMPPPLAHAVALRIKSALTSASGRVVEGPRNAALAL